MAIKGNQGSSQTGRGVGGWGVLSGLSYPILQKAKKGTKTNLSKHRGTKGSTGQFMILNIKKHDNCNCLIDRQLVST